MKRLGSAFGITDVQGLLLALVLALPPLVMQLSRPAPRLDSDAVEYYSHLRSLYFDHDLDFANEFDHFGLLTRGDKTNLTPTGHRRTIFSVGPALLWMPFYAAGDLLARAQGDVEQGYSPTHIRAVCLGSLFYGVLGLLLVHGVVKDVVPGRAASLSVLLLLYATFLWWYLVYEPVMSHPGSFCLSAAVLALWWRVRPALTPRRALALGLLIGLAATLRWQNGVLLLLPAATLLPRLIPLPLATMRTGLVTLTGFAVGASPQLFAWKAIFGQYLLADPPHGRDFLRLDHPYLLQTFFSSRHGLLFWTPILWAGYLGVVLFLKRDRKTALSLLLPLALMSYVNVCSGDWWAGGSFSNRRFDSVLPLLAVGLAVAIGWLSAAIERRPSVVLIAGGLGLTLWNALLMAQYKTNRLPLDETVSFTKVTEQSASLVSFAVGTPLAWPANWIFAREHALPAAQYDLAVGKYLFYRQNNLGGVIDLGNDRVDPALLGEGWGPRRNCEGALCRGVRGEARLLAPLDVPETLALGVRARGTGALTVAVNGTGVAAFRLSEALALYQVRVPAERWRRELNDVTLGLAEPGAAADVERVVFERPPR
jgi:hypothetical protein